MGKQSFDKLEELGDNGKEVHGSLENLPIQILTLSTCGHWACRKKHVRFHCIQVQLVLACSHVVSLQPVLIPARSNLSESCR
jgi:hypothetical protein